MLKKILGKTSDYLFGFGDKKDYYNAAIEYNWAFESEGEQRISNFSLKGDKLAKIMIRSVVTSFQIMIIHNAITQRNYHPLLALPMLEIPRIFSLLADYINKKRILKKKEEVITQLLKISLEDLLSEVDNDSLQSEDDLNKRD